MKRGRQAIGEDRMPILQPFRTGPENRHGLGARDLRGVDKLNRSVMGSIPRAQM